MKLAQKVLVFGLLLSLFFSASPRPARAQSTPPPPIDCNISFIPGINDICNGLLNAFTLTGQSVSDRFSQWLVGWGTTSLIKGIINGTDQVFLGGSGVFNSQTGEVAAEDRHPGGIWSFNMVNNFYKDLPSGNTLSNLSLIVRESLPFDSKVNAQWTRATVSSRDIVWIANELWATIRNIAYLLIVVILVVFGFAVMFRYKTDPRTVITVEQAIPGLVLGLIAIAFSSLIPALSLDLSKVLQSTTASIFKPLNRVPTPTSGNCRYGGTGYTGQALCEPIPVKSPIDLTFNGGLDDIPGSLIGETFNIGRPMDGVIAWAVNWGVLITYLTIFVAVIMRYASLIIRAVLGPFVIALGIIPGQRNIIANWVKGSLADGLSIAGIYFMVNLAVYLWDLGVVNNPPAGFSPQPTLTSGDLVNGTGSAYNIIWTLGIAVAILATRVPAYIDEALGVTPSAASRGGVDFRQAMRGTPIVGGFF